MWRLITTGKKQSKLSLLAEYDCSLTDTLKTIKNKTKKKEKWTEYAISTVT